MGKKVLFFLFTYLLVLLLYYPALNTFFSQDDFFHFKASLTDGTLTGFLNLFKFHSFEERNYAFYRPLSREALYNISYSLFGLKHIPLRILSFIIQFINIYLVYRLMLIFYNAFKKTTPLGVEELKSLKMTLAQKRAFQRTTALAVGIYKSEKIAFFTAFFFGISSANIAILYYLAGGVQALLATMFVLLTLILFQKHKIFSFLTFILALMSHEQASITPVLLAGVIFTRVPFKNFFQKTIFNLWPYFIMVAIYAYLDLIVIGFSGSEKQYSFDFSPLKLVNTLSWYAAWSLGLPEMVIDFVLPGLKLNPSLLRYWPHFYNPIFFGFIVSLMIGLISALYLLITKKGVFKNKVFWFFVFWFPVSLSPVLFLPSHKSTYYLSLALPAFWSVFGYILINAHVLLRKKYSNLTKLMTGTFLLSLLILLTFSAKAGSSLYWAASRGQIAKSLILQVSQKYPTIPAGGAIFFTNDPSYPYVAKDWGGTSKQASYILNNEDALQLFYKNNNIRVFFEDLGGVPKDFSGNIYPLTAKIN